MGPADQPGWAGRREAGGRGGAPRGEGEVVGGQVHAGQAARSSCPPDESGGGTRLPGESGDAAVSRLREGQGHEAQGGGFSPTSSEGQGQVAGQERAAADEERGERSDETVGLRCHGCVYELMLCV